MNPYQSYMTKAAMGELRRAFLSGKPMDPRTEGRFKEMVTRFSKQQLRKAGVPGDPTVRPSVEDGTFRMGLPLKDVHIEVDHRKPVLFGMVREPMGKSDFSVRNIAPGAGAGVPVGTMGKTNFQDIRKKFQGQGIGSRTAVAMDNVMSALGATHLKTDVVNVKHVSGYRKRLGYEIEKKQMYGNVPVATMGKRVPDTYAVARDRAMAHGFSDSRQSAI